MKIGFVVGSISDEYAKRIHTSLEREGLKPNFILFCFSKPRKIFKTGKIKTMIKNIILRLAPLIILKLIFQKHIPNVDTKIYYVKGINSNRAFEILNSEKPNIAIVYGCGIIGKRLCENFHNVLLNAHAGKLPEFRGKNNVEWCYLEDKPLIGTIHFIASGVDTGDIVYEQELDKVEFPNSIDEIRQKAFDQVFDLFPKAIKVMQNEGFKPIKQPNLRTTRYVMHPFFKRILENKLKMK